MTTIAISMVKDEVDIVGHTIRRMLAQVDHVIVADNLSSDGTSQMLDQMQSDARLTVLEDRDPAYYQSRKMTALAHHAREMGATWVVPFDADEVWLARDGRVADLLAAQPDDVLVAQAALYDHRATALDHDEQDPTARIGWRRREPAPLPKVACRALPRLTIEQGNHGAAYEHTDHPLTLVNALHVRHFPYRSPEQFVSKVRNGSAAYAASDLPDHTGAHWRQYGQILESSGEDAVKDIFREWFWSAHPTSDPELIFDPCP